MAIKPAENLKSFANHRPPFIVFLVCLLLFAIALISLGIYIQNHDVINYEDQDWNEFLLAFSQQKFCIPLNETVAPPPKSLNALEPTTAEPNTETFNINDYVGSKNVSISINLKLHPVQRQKLQSLVGLSSLSSTISAKQVNLDQKYEDIDVVFHLTHPVEDAICDDESCPESRVSACLTLALPQKALPLISQSVHPDMCNRSVTHHSLSYSWTMYPKNDTEMDSFCPDGIIVNTEHVFNPKLTFYLSEEEKSIINLHLMYTSYFLFIMLITCVFYALIKGPPLKSRVLHENGHKKLPPI